MYTLILKIDLFLNFNLFFLYHIYYIFQYCFWFFKMFQVGSILLSKCLFSYMFICNSKRLFMIEISSNDVCK